MTETKKEPGMLQLVIILTVICALTSLCLGLVNLITVDRIAEIKLEKTNAAMQAVLASDAYTEVAYGGGDELVSGVYQAGDKGYVVQVGPSGFGGTIEMVVGIGMDGNVTGVDIISMVETSGLGTEADKDYFKGQYNGQPGPFAVNKDGGTIDAITGATVTSRAVTDGVNAALAAVQSLG